MGACWLRSREELSGYVRFKQARGGLARTRPDISRIQARIPSAVYLATLLQPIFSNLIDFIYRILARFSGTLPDCMAATGVWGRLVRSFSVLVRTKFCSFGRTRKAVSRPPVIITEMTETAVPSHAPVSSWCQEHLHSLNISLSSDARCTT